MKNETREALKIIPNLGEDLIQLLEVEDSQFDAIYPQIKPTFIATLDTETAQKEMIANLKSIPAEEVQEGLNTLKDFEKQILSDETLSENKKDIISVIFDTTIKTYEMVSEVMRERITVKIVKLSPKATIPQYAHVTDAGADITAIGTTTIKPNETKIIKTGIAVACPVGYEIQIRPRSGLSAKTGMRIANAPATIDSDFRGEIGIIMHNTGTEEYKIKAGDRIAQMLIAPTPMINWEEVETVEELGSTERGKGGFGSTGQ